MPFGFSKAEACHAFFSPSCGLMAALPVFYALYLQCIKSCRCLSCARLRVATGCGAVMTFAGKSKSHAIPLLQAIASLPTSVILKTDTGGYTR